MSKELDDLPLSSFCEELGVMPLSLAALFDDASFFVGIELEV